MDISAETITCLCRSFELLHWIMHIQGSGILCNA